MLKCFCCKKKRPKTIMDRIGRKPKSHFFGCKQPRSEMESQQEAIREMMSAIDLSQEEQPIGEQPK